PGPASVGTSGMELTRSVSVSPTPEAFHTARLTKAAMTPTVPVAQTQPCGGLAAASACPRGGATPERGDAASSARSSGSPGVAAANLAYWAGKNALANTIRST